MGIPCLWLTLLGVLVGQVVTWSNLIVWLGWTGLADISGVIQEAVRLAVQDCLELEVTTTTTTTSPVPFLPSIHWYGASISIGVRFDFLLVVGLASFSITTTLGLLWLGCCNNKWNSAINDPPSPLSGELPIALVARNQLAEIRLRRHGPHQ